MKLKEYYNKVITDYKSSYCNRLLFKAKLKGDYFLQIKCPRCKNITEFQRKTLIDKKEEK